MGAHPGQEKEEPLIEELDSKDFEEEIEQGFEEELEEGEIKVCR